jgi:hypothetical protein
LEVGDQRGDGVEAMYDVTIARALHVVSVVIWIGGVGFVTTVLLPAVRRQRNELSYLIGSSNDLRGRRGFRQRLWD